MHHLSVYSGLLWDIAVFIFFIGLVLVISLMRMATLCDRGEEKRQAQRTKEYFDVIIRGGGK